MTNSDKDFATFLLINYPDLLHKPAIKSDIENIACIYRTVYHVLHKYRDKHIESVHISQNTIRDSYYFLLNDTTAILKYINLNQ